MEGLRCRRRFGQFTQVWSRAGSEYFSSISEFSDIFRGCGFRSVFNSQASNRHSVQRAEPGQMLPLPPALAGGKEEYMCVRAGFSRLIGLFISTRPPVEAGGKENAHPLLSFPRENNQRIPHARKTFSVRQSGAPIAANACPNAFAAWFAPRDMGRITENLSPNCGACVVMQNS
jgi:hypothetical protein